MGSLRTVASVLFGSGIFPGQQIAFAASEPCEFHCAIDEVVCLRAKVIPFSGAAADGRHRKTPKSLKFSCGKYLWENDNNFIYLWLGVCEPVHLAPTSQAIEAESLKHFLVAAGT